MRATWRLVGAWAVAGALGLVGAGAAGGCDASVSLPGGEGQPCQSSSDCGGLTCLDYGVPADGRCTSYGQQCVQTCKTSADCASAGAGFGCYPSCSGDAADVMVCQPPPPGDAGSLGDAGALADSESHADASSLEDARSSADAGSPGDTGARGDGP